MIYEIIQTNYYDSYSNKLVPRYYIVKKTIFGNIPFNECDNSKEDIEIGIFTTILSLVLSCFSLYWLGLILIYFLLLLIIHKKNISYYSDINSVEKQRDILIMKRTKKYNKVLSRTIINKEGITIEKL